MHLLKEEIRRLAKKEVKAEVTATKQAVAKQRSEIASLKRTVNQQEREIKRLQKKVQQQSQATVEEEPLENVRFSARSVKSQRTRLGLSASDYGKLIGVAGITVYSWEKGNSRPRPAQLEALVAVRGIGKREAVARLEELKAKKKRRKR